MPFARSFGDLPIARKLSTAFMLTTTVVVLLACAGFFAYEYRASRRQLVAGIATIAAITASNSTAVIAFQDLGGARQTLSALKAESQIIAAGLYDGSGALLAAFPANDASAVPPASPPIRGATFHRGRLLFVQPVAEGDRVLGTLYIEATLAHMYERLGAYGLVVGVVALLAGGIAWALASVFRRRIAGPIVELARVARGFSERRDYSIRARHEGGDELGTLTRSFNDMLETIQKGLASQAESASQIQELNAELERRVQERTAELEAANKELESFSYSVSHDLRAPLRHMQGYAEMLVRATDGSLSERAARYLKVITEAGSSMAELIDDLLAFSRMGRASLSEAVVDLGPLVEEMRQAQDAATQGRRIVWRVGTLPPVCADEAMLRLVFANLFGNAVKFTRPRDPAEIEIGCAGRERERLVLFVRDNGVGFDMTYSDKLFGVFQRLHRAEEFEGTGIGLANVQRIIARHGGRVWAEGEPNRGATFFFTLRPAEAGRTEEP